MNNRFLKLNPDVTYDSASSIGDFDMTPEQHPQPRFFANSGTDSCFSGSSNSSVGNHDDVSSESEDQIQTSNEEIKTNSKSYCLASPWTLHYSDKDMKLEQQNTPYAADHIEVFTCDTVQSFWQPFNRLYLPTQLKFRSNSNYFFFRNAIKPEWEDPANTDGGMFRIILKGQERSDHLDLFWVKLLLALIGESLDADTNLITGLVLQRRQKEDRLCLWLRDCTEEQQKSLEAAVIKLLNLGEGTYLMYMKHDDQRKSNEYRQRMSFSPSGSIDKQHRPQFDRVHDGKNNGNRGESFRRDSFKTDRSNVGLLSRENSLSGNSRFYSPARTVGRVQI